MADRIKNFVYGLSYSAALLFVGPIIVYIAVRDFGRDFSEGGGGVGFELATISSILGGLILAVGFADKSSDQLQTKLRRIGVFYLMATVAFVAYQLWFPLIDIWAVTWVVGFAMVVGALSFSIATLQLVFTLPELWVATKKPQQ